ncbi:MAG: helix-turn-helix domain-containing protein [Clostridiales bacterium]|nr:helix-turn-helix domain-containing protein [Eubacteriales bacterium]MDH7566384.1 helix-turn-helix domain-containing protein [Clostridiales bacterium]
MGISLQTIYEKFHHCCPKLFISQESRAFVKSARFLTDSCVPDDPEILYVGKVSDLAGILASGQVVNVLCVADEEISAAYRQKSSLNLLLLEKAEDITTVFNEVLDIFYSSGTFTPSYDKLLDAILHTKGIQQLIHTGYELFGNPLCIFEPTGRLIALTEADSVPESYWDELVKDGQLSYETMSCMEYKNIISRTNRSRLPIVIKEPHGLSKISGKIKIGKIIVGYVWLIGAEKELCDADIDIVSFFCHSISLEIQKSRPNKSFMEGVHENLIKELLKGSRKNNKLVNEWIKSLGFNANDSFFVLTIAAKQYDLSTSPLSYPVYLMNLLENSIDGSKGVIYKDHIVVLVRSNPSNPLTDLKLNKLESFLEKYKLKGGMSHDFSDLNDTYYFYRQSLKAIDLGSRENKERGLYLYNDCAIMHFLDICSKKADLFEFCHPSIFLLMNADNKNSTSYLQTLYTYILYNGNQIKSAAALNINRATIIYRIQKIEEIMKLKLCGFNIMHRLYLSFMILRYLNKLPFI